MKNNLTEIVFILDKSGSMWHLTDDTIGGYNSFLQEQKNTEGESKVTTVLFSNTTKIIHDAIDIKNVKPLTREDYIAHGSTALMDAVGETINKVGQRLASTPEEERPSKVIFVITTDGEENSSREFNRAKIKEMITHQTNKYNWQFMFLGANIDAVSEAESIGIRGMFASNYVAGEQGTEILYNSLSKTVSNYRTVGEIQENWSKDLNN
jgi:von Willebrand factor type A domain.